MQIAGLVVLPLAILMELNLEGFGQSKMLTMMIFGASVFYLGRLCEGYARG